MRSLLLGYDLNSKLDYYLGGWIMMDFLGYGYSPAFRPLHIKRAEYVLLYLIRH